MNKTTYVAEYEWWHIVIAAAVFAVLALAPAVATKSARTAAGVSVPTVTVQ